MSKDKQQGIEMIKCGRIDCYIPLMFEMEGSFEDICYKINNRLDKDFTSIHSKLVQGKADIVHIDISDNNIKVGVSAKELEVYHNKRNELISFYENFKEIYGLKYINSQEIFVLLPLQVQLNNEELVWLNAMLFIFQNKMGVLKLELPLKNVSSDMLMEYKYDEYIRNIKYSWVGSTLVENNTFYSIQQLYINKIKDEGTIGVKVIGACFYNILLSDFDGMPKQINNISNKVIVDLYRIIAAPVTIMDCTSYETEAQDYIKEHQWMRHNSRYICSTTGACLSITDIAFRDYYMEKYMQKTGICKIEEEDRNDIYEKILINLCLNVEYAIIILILKHITQNRFYESFKRMPQKMHEIKEEYNQNIMYISEVQEACYGSVSEQVETLQKIMPYYLKEKNMENKLKALDNIISAREVQRRENLQNFIGLGGFLMTACFGLPSISETFSIIRNSFFLISIDIPLITIQNFSCIVWLIVLCVIVVRLKK